MESEKAVLFEVDQISEVNQNNSKNYYFEDTLQAAEICLSDSPSKIENIEVQNLIKLKRYSNISQISFTNFLQILEEKNEDSDEYDQSHLLNDNQNDTLQKYRRLSSDRMYNCLRSPIFIKNQKTFMSDFKTKTNLGFEFQNSYCETNRNSNSTSNSNFNYSQTQDSHDLNSLNILDDDYQIKVNYDDFKININQVNLVKQIQFDSRTTLMIKNIPNKYTNNLLKDKINLQFKDKYDFFYLPMDFQYKCNMGYAFINMKNRNEVFQFYNFLNGKKWDFFKSKKVFQKLKVCEIKYARVQGKVELEKHIKINEQKDNPKSLVFAQNKFIAIEELVLRQKNQ